MQHANFYKGDGTGEFYFTNFSLNGHDGVLSTLNCNDVKLDFNSYIKLQGNMVATNTDIKATYLRIATGGSLKMDGGSLTLSGTQNEPTYYIFGKMTLNNVKFESSGYFVSSYGVDGNTDEPNKGDVVFSGSTSFTGDKLIVEDEGALSIIDTATVDVNSLDATNLSASSDAKVSVSSLQNLSIDNLNMIMNDDYALNFSDIFISDDGETISFSTVDTTISVFDKNGNQYEYVEFAYDDNGNITGIAAVPEPSECAVLFGALAAAIAIYRRRR